MSDGLVPPFNAPPAGAAVPGIQPGDSGLDLAQIVIIFGPSGTISGLFEYEPGTTPGLGNPPVVAITASTTDPYGNPLPTGGIPSVLVQAVGGTGPYVIINPPGGENFASVNVPTREAMEQDAGGMFGDVLNQGLGTEQLVTSITSPTGQQPFADTYNIFLQSQSQDGTIPTGWYLTYFNSAFNGTNQIVALPTGVQLLGVSALTAQAPGAATPTQESWHNISLASGLTGTLRVKRAAESNFAIYDVNVNFSYTAAAQTFTCGSAPSGSYYPTSQRLYSPAVNGTVTPGSALSLPRFFIPGSSGAVQVIVPPGTGSNAEFCGTFWVPLD